MQPELLISLLSQLKYNSLKFKEKLRFPISKLQIKIGKSWRTFPNLTGSVTTKGNQKLTTGLSEVLLDTGNESSICVMGGQFLNAFEKNIKDIETTYKKQGRMVGSPRILQVSEEIFELKFCNVPFKSEIGFVTPVDVDDFNCFNIGIKSISKFLNIIIPPNYYYCMAIDTS